MINRKTIIVLEVLQSKDIPDLLDKVAGRIYTLDGVEDVTAQLAGEFERVDDEYFAVGGLVKPKEQYVIMSNPVRAFVRVDVEQMGS